MNSNRRSQEYRHQYPLRFRPQGAGPLRRPLLFGQMMRTYVYVDGFNLYYGVLKGKSWSGWTCPRFSPRSSSTSNDSDIAEAMRRAGNNTRAARRNDEQRQRHRRGDAPPEASSSRQKGRTGYARDRATVPPAFGTCGFREAYPPERIAAVAVAGPDSRYNDQQAVAVAAGLTGKCFPGSLAERD